MAEVSGVDPDLSDLKRLIHILARLRHPTLGCAWDKAQTFTSIAPYTIEEAYEVADACARGDLAALRDELGDLLLQVVFHARIAEEQGAFTLSDVATAIVDKMMRRHPQIFANADANRAVDSRDTWEAVKSAERAASGGDTSAMAGVALALPALMRAEKLQARAARTGFDWPDSSGARDKIDEELGEVAAAVDEEEQLHEMGDLLFSVVNWARKLGIDPEVALRHGNAKFERRFRAMEEIAGNTFADLSLRDKDTLWNEVKRGAG